jgi:hypothetical protein
MQTQFRSWWHAGWPWQDERGGTRYTTGSCKSNDSAKLQSIARVNSARRTFPASLLADQGIRLAKRCQGSNPRIKLPGMDAAPHIHNPAETPASCILRVADHLFKSD